MNKKMRKGLYEQVFDVLPLGLFLIAQDRSIYAWNSWMVVNTTIAANTAIGQPITSLYPDYVNPRFTWALDAALNQGHPQLLSTILNKFVIPISLDKHAYPNLDMMQQNAEILPFYYDDQCMALVVIQDVTDKTHLKNTLMSMALRFENSSFIDSLTDLYNRRFLWEYLNSELESAKRDSYSIVCCLFDLDYFKKINDEFGHSAGDEVLISFAQLAKSVTRPSDHLIRYGGEEFLAIFTKIKIDDAVKLANRLRTKLEATRSHGSVNKTITCSGGISYWRPSDPLISAEKLVDQADRELYKAKKKGRNCIIVNNPVP